MVLLQLLILLSCSWSIGHAMESNQSLLFPVLYTVFVILVMISPKVYDYFWVRGK